MKSRMRANHHAFGKSLNGLEIDEGAGRGAAADPYDSGRTAVGVRFR
jgi:hypothetical protein